MHNHNFTAPIGPGDTICMAAARRPRWNGLSEPEMGGGPAGE
ncbi:MAG TPA: hypothetical protein ACFCUD_00015 [Cyclobacteriaceae bacterium]